MKKNKAVVLVSIFTFLIAVGLFAYTVNESKMLSYLSSDPKACINCHTMNSAYTTWSKSSHKNVAGCIDCHLPHGDIVAKYKAKSIDGWNHSVAFTTNSYKNNIKISEDGANRVQDNCIRCHSSQIQTMAENANNYHGDSDFSLKGDRKCWECHKYTPHGKVRSLNSTPFSIGVKEQMK